MNVVSCHGTEQAINHTTDALSKVSGRAMSPAAVGAPELPALHLPRRRQQRHVAAAADAACGDQIQQDTQGRSAGATSMLWNEQAASVAVVGSPCWREAAVIGNGDWGSSYRDEKSEGQDDRLSFTPY